MIPGESECIFKNGFLDHFRERFRKPSVRLASELGEPEVKDCSFKISRTFSVTKISYPFDMNKVQNRLRQTPIITTQIFVQRSHSMNREYLNHVIRTIEEAQLALENGYKHVAKPGEVLLWRNLK